MSQTRGQYLGVQPGRIAARTRRRLEKIRAILTDIAVDWQEADSAVGFDCDQLRDEGLKTLEETVTQGVELLREPMFDD